MIKDAAVDDRHARYAYDMLQQFHVNVYMHTVFIFNYMKCNFYKLPLFLIGTLVRSKFVGTPTGGNCEHSGRTFEFGCNMI